MTRHHLHHRIAAAGFVALAACAPRPPMPQQPQQADLSAQIVRTADDTAPEGPEGACWATDASPAVIETVTEQVQTSPESRAADGTLTAPATYRTRTQTRMVRDRATVWFRAPCPETVTADFIASLQRALKARGYFAAPLTGALDAATTDALRRFQTDRGLDSAKLSLAAARDLGLVATELDAL